MSGVPRHLVVSAWESLATGDEHEALAILSNALEYGGPLPLPCPICGARAWPEARVHHIYGAHLRAELGEAA